MLSSESTVPSSPTPIDQAVFSDEAAAISSPPSSPPGFPWEYQSTSSDAPTTPSKPPRTAFSLLGKRKALDGISDNARPTKRPARTTAKPDAKALTQLQISLGQQVQKKCKTCGMEYVASSAEDRKLHDKFHKQNTEGFDVGKDFVRNARGKMVFEGVSEGDSICVVDCLDKPPRRRRAQAVLEIVQRELGAVAIPEKEIWESRTSEATLDSEPKFRAYLYIRATKCVGFLLVERIEEARRVVEPMYVPSKHAPSRAGESMTALAALRARRQALQDTAKRAASQPIQVSEATCPANIGISRIWTLPHYRHENIATTLLDTALTHHNQCADRHLRLGAEEATKPDNRTMENTLRPLRTVGKEDVAFSQPTEAGARLARRWFGKLYGWGVYID